MKTSFSKHMTEDRADRYIMIATKVGFGEVLYTATEDHRGRLEVTRIVELTSTGVVIVRAMDKTVVTMYCATIATALNLFHMDKLPPELYKTIRTNEKRGYCNIQLQYLFSSGVHYYFHKNIFEKSIDFSSEI